MRDEFEGSSISEKNWRYRTGEKVNGNSIKEAVSVSDGVLKIRVVHNNGSYVQDSNSNNTNILSKMPYICGSIISKKRDFEYGYYEANIKMPASYGFHSSFWTIQGFWNSQETFDTQNEVDICEYDSSPTNNNAFHANMHMWKPNHLSLGAILIKKNNYGNINPNLTTSFNRIGGLVTENFVAIYVNGILSAHFYYKSLSKEYKINPTEILLTCLAYTNPDLLDKDEDFMEVDYVRYYRLAPKND